MKIGTSRAETFSDGVMAIVITIMVLELLPELNASVDQDQVLQYIREIFPKFITYAFSFLMISILWINHHHMFHLLKRTDEVLLLQNLFFLFWMSLIPMATAILGANPFVAISVGLYGLIMLLTTLSFTLMRIRTTKTGLLHKDKDKVLSRKIKTVSLKARTKSIIGTCAYFASIPIAFIDIRFSFACFLIPPLIFFIPDGIDDEKLADKIDAKN